MEYTREKLIEICEKAIVKHDQWSDRDSASSHIGVGTCWALLKAGCKFQINTKENIKGDCVTDNHTIWIQLWVKDFGWFEYAEEEEEDGYDKSDYHFYLPTEKRLKEANSKDWY